MKIPMADRRTMVRPHAKEYQHARKGGKSRILDVFVKATGYNRAYAARLLRGHGRRVCHLPKILKALWLSARWAGILRVNALKSFARKNELEFEIEAEVLFLRDRVAQLEVELALARVRGRKAVSNTVKERVCMSRVNETAVNRAILLHLHQMSWCRR